MSDKDINITDKGDLQTDDSLSLRSGGWGKTSKGRKISSAQVIHTVGAEGIEIPESADAEGSDTVLSRFIKANSTPFVSVNGAGEDDGDSAVTVEKFTDRLTPKAPEKKTAPMPVKKGNSYSATHSLSPEKGRMISPEEEPQEAESMKAGEEAVENAPEQIAETGITPEESPAQAQGEEKDVKQVKTKKILFKGKKSGENGGNDDKSPTKTMPDPKGMLLREIAHTAEDDVRMNPDQLMMDGFDTVGKDEGEGSDGELEKELDKTRQKRINSFTFWGKKEESEASISADGKFARASKPKNLPDFVTKAQKKFAHLNTDFNPVPGGEYTDFNNRKEVFSGLIEGRKKAVIRLLAVGLLGLVLLIADLITGASASANANGFFTVFGGNSIVYSAFNLCGLVLCCVLMIKDLKFGLFSLLKVHPKADTSLLLIMLSAIAQNILAFFTQLKPESSFRLLAPAAILICVPYLLGKIFYYDSARHCFKAAAIKGDKSYLRCVSDGELVSDLLRDRENKDQNVVYSGKIRFVENFIARSAKSAKAGMPSSRSVIITAGVSFIVGLIVTVLKADFTLGLSAVTLCLILSFPISCLTVTGFDIAKENKKLSVKSSFILSHEDARDFSAIDNIIVKDSDIFTAEITDCLTAKSVSDKQAKFCAAVLTNKFGGPLNAALETTVSSLEDKFPSAENLVYEEKLGLSAWVSGCKVLLGTHTLLVNHNVEVPDEQTALAFFGEGQVPVYLAIEGRFAAVFAVKYSCKPNTPNSLRQLVKNGSSILLSTFDANLSEEYAEKLLDMPPCSVRTVNSSLADRLSSCMQGVKESEEAGMVFTDSFESLCRCAGSAMTLDRSKKITKLICEAGAYVGLVLAGAISLTGAFSSASPILALFVQILWLTLCFGAAYVSSSAKIDIKLPSLSKRADETKPTEPIALKFSAENPSREAEEEPDTVHEQVSTDETESGAADSENKTAQPEEIPEEVREEKAAEEDVPGVVSQATYDALDDYAADPVERRGKRLASAEDESSESTENPGDDAEEQDASPGMDAWKKKAMGFMKGLVSRITVESEDEEEAEAEPSGETPSDSAPKKQKKAAAESAHRKSIRRKPSYEAQRLEQQREEDRIKALFTPPEIPSAPSYDLSPKEEPSEDPLEAKFVPPEITQSGYYSDEFFSPFEDDKIFSPLRENK